MQNQRLETCVRRGLLRALYAGGRISEAVYRALCEEGR